MLLIEFLFIFIYGISISIFEITTGDEVILQPENSDFTIICPTMGQTFTLWHTWQYYGDVALTKALTLDSTQRKYANKSCRVSSTSIQPLEIKKLGVRRRFDINGVDDLYISMVTLDKVIFYGLSNRPFRQSVVTEVSP